MDRIDQLLFAVLEQPDDRWAEGVDALCAEQTEHANEIRRRFAVLRDLGLERPEPVQPPPDFPERLGDFRLRERLGGGGMGVVYRAEQASLQRTVALKLVRPELLYFPKAKDRFRREVETIAKLAHPGIVAIHAVGEDQGIQYFAMELVDGLSLEQVVQRLASRAPERLTGADLAALLGSHDALFAGGWPDVCVRIVRRVAEALAHAHARGVIHRDVKPSNVMLTRDGRVVLLDFGLAQAQGSGRVTRTGTLLGSLAYMAPEQVRGEHDRVDARSDVYSLGVTLYELLTLRSPFEAASAETTRQNILAGVAPPARLLNRQVSGDAATVCGKAIDHDPRRRYQDAAAFARDLDNLLARRDVAARPPTLGRRARLWTARHPAAAVGLGAALLALIGTPTAITFAIAGQRDRARAAEALTLRNSYAANLTAAWTALQTGNGYEARRRHELCPPALRGWEWRHLALQLDGSLRTLVGHAAPVTAVALAADARTVASGAADGEVILWDGDAGTARRRWRVGPSAITQLSFSPADATLRAADLQGTIAVLDPDVDAPRARLAAEPRFLRAAFALDDASIWRNEGGWRLRELDPHDLSTRRELALEIAGIPPEHWFGITAGTLIADSSSKYIAWELAGGRKLRTLPGPQETTTSLGLERRGRLLAYGTESGAIRMVEPVTAEQFSLHVPGAPAHALVFDPTGNLLVAGCKDAQVHVFDVGRRRRKSTQQGHAGPIQALAAEVRDIPWVASGSRDATVKLWSAHTVRAVTVLRRPANFLAASPDGQLLLSGCEDGTATIWNAATGAVRQPLQGYTHWVLTVGFSPDGRTVLGSYGQTLVLHEVGTGELRASILTGLGRVRRSAWNRDGSRLAVGDEGGSIEIRDGVTMAVLHRLTGHATIVRGLAFAPAGDVLFSASNDGHVLRWELGAEPVARTLQQATPVERDPAASRLPRRCSALLLTADASKLVYTSDTGLRAIDPDTGAMVWERRVGILHCLAELPDGSRLLTGSDDGSLTFWDPARGEALLSLRAHDGAVQGVVCDPHGRWCATCGPDVSLRIWRATAREELPALDDPTLLNPVALEYATELLSDEQHIDRARRAAAARTDWTPRLQQEVLNVLGKLGIGGDYYGQIWAWHRLLHADLDQAMLERIEYVMRDVETGHYRDVLDVLLHMRRGRDAAAERSADVLLRAKLPEITPDLQAAVRAARAIALHRLGRKDEARAELVQAREACATLQAKDQPGPLGLLREAEDVLQR